MFKSSLGKAGIVYHYKRTAVKNPFLKANSSSTVQQSVIRRELTSRKDRNVKSKEKKSKKYRMTKIETNQQKD